MPNRKSDYKDMEKYTLTRNAQRKRYYSKTSNYGWNHWSVEQDRLVLSHIMTDTELSHQIGHSVAAIQMRRHLLKHNKI